MATHDYNLANQTGADFRADLNDVLQAVLTLNSSATEPTTTAAYMLWLDTANGVLKIRNGADDAWVILPLSISADNTVDINAGTIDGISQLTLGSSTSVNSILDEDNLNSDSPTALATQQSIKAYVDSQVTAQDLDFQGDSGGVLSIDLDSEVLTLNGGTGIDTVGSENTMQFSIDSTVVTLVGVQVLTNKSIDADNNTIANLEVDNLKAGVLDTDLDAVSASDDTLASAKAIKTYVDANITAQDLDVSDGTTGIAIDLDSETLSLLGGTGVSSTASGDGVTFAIGQPVGTTDNVSFGVVTANLTGQVSDISNHSTSDLSEGTNLYYTTSRFDTRLATKDTDDLTEGTNLYYTQARFDSALTAKSTSDLSEGANLYYTTARANTDFDTRLAAKDTDSLSEGTTNLYYTTSRVNSDFDTRLATKDTSDLTEGTNLYYTTARFDSAFSGKSTTNLSEGTNLYYTDARFDTRLATKDTDDLTEGTNLYYTSARFDSAFTGKSTSDLSEGTNLYYTDARANSAIDTRVTKTFVDNLGVVAGSVQANSVTLGTDTTGNYIQTITGTSNKITVTGSGSESADVTLTLPDDVQIADSLTVAGNLTVNGTLTSLDTTNLDIEDNLFQLNAGLTGSPVNDSGMLINRGNQDNGIFMWDESADKFTLGLTTADGSATGNITLNSLGTLVANIEGNITGNVTGTVSDVSNHDTDDIGEGSTNLYFTNARADARVNLQTGANLDLSSKSTSDLSEGTNEYFTTARARSSISASGDISYNSSTGVISFTASASPVTSVNTLTGAVVLDSDDIAEGSTNLYYTDARARAAISEGSTQLAYNSTTGVLTYTQGDTDTVSEGTTNLYYTSARFNSAFSGKSTSDLSEGTNLYYTDARAQAVSINNVVEDTTPQLGGDLDLNSSDITGTGDISITGAITASGAITGTLATAAQPNITSVGTLTGFTSTGIDDNADATAITINSSENVGIGVVPETWQSTVDALQIGLGASVAASTTNASRTFINANAYTNSGNVESYIATDEASQYFQNAGTHIFKVAASGSADSAISWTTAMTIDNSGNVLVGKTAESSATDGIELNRQDVIVATRNGDAPLILNRRTSDGDIALFRKDNSTIGAIGVNSSDNIYFTGVTGNTKGLLINDQGYIPTNAGGSALNATVDIGNDSYKYKDLYLSGAASIGNLKIGTDQGTDGQVLTSTGSGVAWEDSAGGVAGIVSNANATAITIDSSENVGIGTGSPARELHIHDSSSDNVYLMLSNTTSGAASGDGFQLFTDGTNAGVLNRENGYLKFTTNNQDRMTISNAGNVGIGTASPSVKLHVEGAGNQLVLVNNSSTNDGLFLKAGTGESAIQTNGGSNVMNFYTSGNERMRIDSSGNVGIGASSIDNNAKLHIEDSAYPIINLDRSSISSDGNHIGYINFQNNGNIYGRIGTWVEDISETDGELHFSTRKGNSLIDRMVITSDGNVNVTGTGDAILLLNTATDAGDNSIIRFGDNSDADAGYIDYSHGTNALSFGANAAERMRIDSSGNLGIGTTTTDIESLGSNYKQLTIASSTSLYPAMVTYQTPSTTNTSAEVARIHYLNGTNRVGQFVVKPDGAANNSAYMSWSTMNAGTLSERMRISSAGYVTMPNQPAFSVAKNNGYIADDNVYVCDTTTGSRNHNDGSHYSTSNGRFTAPVAGRYFFAFNVMTHDSGGVVQAWVAFRKNGTIIQYCLGHKTGGYHTRFAHTASFKLAANDYIEAYVGESGTSSGWQGSASEYNNFSGYLIG